MKSLGNNPGALRAQREQLRLHLARQHRDRQVYYHQRARSRLAATSLGVYVLTYILDSMDQAKHCWPRSEAMKSKVFSNWGRPRLVNTALLAHGHMALVVLSPHYISACSSRTCEIIAHSLSLLERERSVDLRHAFLHLQGDNCAKELKNLSVLRLVAMQTCLKRIKGAEVSFLQSGHSHEDVDAFFSVLRSWLGNHPELWTPDSFKASLDKFFEDASHRPHEPFRRVLMQSQFQDWPLAGWAMSDICAFVPSRLICFVH